jgi:hypothetical protein
LGIFYHFLFLFQVFLDYFIILFCFVLITPPRSAALRHLPIAFCHVFDRRRAYELRRASGNPYPSPPRPVDRRSAVTARTTAACRRIPDLRRRCSSARRTTTTQSPPSGECIGPPNSGRRRFVVAGELDFHPLYITSTPAEYSRRRRATDPPSSSTHQGGARGAVTQRRRGTESRRGCAGDGGRRKFKRGFAGGGRGSDPLNTKSNPLRSG